MSYILNVIYRQADSTNSSQMLDALRGDLRESGSSIRFCASISDETESTSGSKLRCSGAHRWLLRLAPHRLRTVAAPVRRGCWRCLGFWFCPGREHQL